MAVGRLQYLEVTEEVGLPVEDSGIGGCRIPDVGGFLSGGASVGATLRIRDMGDIYTHWEDSGRISPLGDTPTDRTESETAYGGKLVLPPTGNGNGRGSLGGCGDICCLSPEHCIVVNSNQTHHGYVYGIGAAPWGKYFPEVVVTGDHVPGGDVGNSKCNVNCGDIGGGRDKQDD